MVRIILQLSEYYIQVKTVNMKNTIINKVQKYRLVVDITQEELAEKVGVTRQTIIAIEKGNYTPSVTLALKLAKYFRKNVEDIFKLN